MLFNYLIIISSHYYTYTKNIKTIIFICTPSHIDIPRSELIDQKASEATGHRKVKCHILLTLYDHTQHIRKIIHYQWLVSVTMKAKILNSKQTSSNSRQALLWPSFNRPTH